MNRDAWWRDTRTITNADGHTVTVWSYSPDAGQSIGANTLFSGIGPGTVGLFCEAIADHGHAIIDSASDRPWNHNVIGCGVGHNDAEFCESGRSMAAYYESGEAFGGYWWEDKSRYGSSRRYYVEPLGKRPATRTRNGRPVRRAMAGQS